MKFFLYLLVLSVLFSCKPIHNHDKSNTDWILELKNGIDVNHSVDTVYATFSKFGNQTYELVFATAVKSKIKNLKMIEFGVYLKNGIDWQFHSPTGKPYTSADFNDWYNCQNGVLQKNRTFEDRENRLLKTDVLSKDTISTLWYYLAEDDSGIQYVGYDEIVGIVDTLDNE